jgi:hypothetical protein
MNVEDSLFESTSEDISSKTDDLLCSDECVDRVVY